MAEYYVVENEQADNPAATAIGTSISVLVENEEEEMVADSITVLEKPNTAKVVKVEAGAAVSVAQIQSAYAQLFPGNSTGTPAVITAAEYKFS